jgi:integration host factor subunit alpha
MALTKCDIVDQIQVQLGFPKNKSGEVTESLLEILKSTLASGDDEVLRQGQEGAQRPATNQAMMLNRRVVTFKCSTQLRDRVNGKHKRRRK